MISEKGNTRGNDFMCHPDLDKNNFDWKGEASALIQNPQFYRFLWTKSFVHNKSTVNNYQNTFITGE